ncbi:MAG: META domain-containing protein [Prevotellaceae bacterium]|jgi:heat shock protein HslJ|nr:META domain-containing protein [Prevotellaceae bacterium]
MKRIIISTASAMICLLLVAACNTPKPASTGASSTEAKKTDPELVEKYWKLVELYGNPVTVEENQKEAHLILKSDGTYNGSAGCNTLLGSYSLGAPGRISFSEGATTLKMCLKGMETEEKFKQVIKMADSYLVKQDTLLLHRARMAPLARFVAVYMK